MVNKLFVRQATQHPPTKKTSKMMNTTFDPKLSLMSLLFEQRALYLFAHKILENNIVVWSILVQDSGLTLRERLCRFS
jgi:hypothetical protein